MDERERVAKASIGFISIIPTILTIVDFILYARHWESVHFDRYKIAVIIIDSLLALSILLMFTDRSVRPRIIFTPFISAITMLVGAVLIFMGVINIAA
ncbi:MAG: hypothetical protein LBT55_07720 [Clostridiaceae bacterium]|jgi:hypothetical protein|nr:hypothetical protein [Clostridiaceae bacterium]